MGHIILIHKTVNIGKSLKTDMINLIQDMDFTENEEFFRKNTLKLGYKNEAERLVGEALKSPITNENQLTRAINKIYKPILNSSFYEDSVINVNLITGKFYSVAITLVTE